jgi:hypothetical protein
MEYGLKDFFKKNLNILIFLIPIIFYAIGFFIHNNYLAKYNIANYELIKGKYIFVGFVYTLIFIAIGFLYFAQTSFSNPKVNFKKDNLFLWFFRFECVLLGFYFCFPGKDKTVLISTDITIFGLIKIPERFTNPFSTLITSTLIIWLLFTFAAKGEYPEKKEKRMFIYQALVMFIPANFVIIWGLMFNKLFSSIFYFLGMYFLYIIVFTLGAAHSQEFLYLKSRFFQEKFSEPLRIIEDKIFMLICTIPIIILLTSIYSRNIYNKLPSNFGGSKPVSVQINYVDSKIVKGDLIDETSDSIIIKFQGENKISIINRESIKEIEIIQ